MAVTVGELIAEVLQKAKIDATEEKYKDILSITTVVNDDLVLSINKSLINIEDAANHPKVKAQVSASMGGKIDTKISQFLEAVKEAKIVSQDVIDSISAEKNTYMKIDYLFDAIKGYKPQSDGKGKASEEEKTELIKQINDLKKSLSEKDNEVLTIKAAKDSEIAEFKKQHKLESVFLGYKWSESIPEKLRLQNAKWAMEEKARELGATIEEENGVLVLKGKDGADIYDSNNKKVEFKGFVDSIMHENKFIATNTKNSHDDNEDVNKTTTVKGQETKVIQNPVLIGLQNSLKDIQDNKQ